MDKLEKFLTSYRKSKVSILELANLCPELSYESFAQEVLRLEKQQILTAVKASGINGKQPPLANVYKINKALVRHSLQQKVKQLKKLFHPEIWVEYYLTKSIEELELRFYSIILTLLLKRLEEQQEITLEQWLEELQQDETTAPLLQSRFLYDFFILLHQRSPIEVKEMETNDDEGAAYLWATLYRILKDVSLTIEELPQILKVTERFAIQNMRIMKWSDEANVL